jgi:hypothetical protein
MAKGIHSECGYPLHKGVDKSQVLLRDKGLACVG